MRKILASESPDWERTIAPRLILGLWHPKFIAPATSILPSVKRCFIGIDLRLAQQPVFWDAVDSYSIAFPALSTREGRKFIEKCKKAGKGIYTWTCNRQEEWVTAAKWGIDVVMTDTPIPYMAERRAVVGSSFSIFPCSLRSSLTHNILSHRGEEAHCPERPLVHVEVHALLEAHPVVVPRNRSQATRAPRRTARALLHQREEVVPAVAMNVDIPQASYLDAPVDVCPSAVLML